MTYYTWNGNHHQTAYIVSDKRFYYESKVTSHPLRIAARSIPLCVGALSDVTNCHLLSHRHGRLSPTRPNQTRSEETSVFCMFVSVMSESRWW